MTLHALPSDLETDTETDLAGRRELVRHGHRWRYTGPEDVSDWPPKDRMWARDRWVCAACRTISLVRGHDPQVSGVENGRHVPIYCSAAKKPRKLTTQSTGRDPLETAMKGVIAFLVTLLVVVVAGWLAVGAAVLAYSLAN